jgi:hypothetical protein
MTSGVACLPASAGAAVTVDRVQVGVPKTPTRAFAENLSVALEAPSAYDRACCTDFVSGAWEGPPVEASASSAPQNASRIEWNVTFARGGRTAASLAAAGGWADYPQIASRRIKVPHIVAGRRVGTLKAHAVTDAQAAPGAQVQAAVALPLGGRITAVTLFHFPDPAADRTSAGDLTVRGTPASAWNRGQSGDAIDGVSLEGSLPPKRISARRSNGRVRGRIADRFGHPVAEVKLQLQRRTGGRWRKAATGVTTSRGAYSLGGARQSGSYRVVAKLGGTTARGAVR